MRIRSHRIRNTFDPTDCGTKSAPACAAIGTATTNNANATSPDINFFMWFSPFVINPPLILDGQY